METKFGTWMLLQNIHVTAILNSLICVDCTNFWVKLELTWVLRPWSPPEYPSRLPTNKLNIRSFM